jgi:Cft2 family RNA processing exonuclease
MQIEFLDTGIFLPELDLWLDPAVPRAAAWLSHAHSDHARGVHGHVFATPETVELYEMRWPDAEGKRRAIRIAFGESIEFRGARLTALPAGHILGAAQLRIEFGGETVVYTGDIKRWPPIAGTAAEVAACDRLIVESTFGLPIYRFLPREEARERISTFARETLADGAVPVFLGYPLGRGQEIAHVLCEAGIPAAVHGAIAKFIPVYRRAGYRFDGWTPYEAGRIEGRALVVTPVMRNIFEASRQDCRIAYVSGWAALANARARVGAEELIPYSDHAGFAELLDIVETSGARRVDLVHGYTEPLAKILRGRGVDAHAARAIVRETEDA